MQVGCGSLTVDFLATVAAYPKPDDKIRTTTLKVPFSSFIFTFVTNCVDILLKMFLNLEEIIYAL